MAKAKTATTMESRQSMALEHDSETKPVRDKYHAKTKGSRRDIFHPERR